MPMLTGPKKWTEKTIEARRKAGYGEGRGPNYKPWISATDLTGDSRVHRMHSPKFKRTIHLLSDVERDTFELLEYAQDVVELEEQKPMDRDRTLTIARALGVRHPYYPGTHVPTVMTIDMVAYRLSEGATLRGQAWDCKYALDEKDEHAINKLQITRRYCEEEGIEHRLILRSSIPPMMIRNIAWIRGGAIKSGEVEPYEGAFEEHLNILAYHLHRAIGDVAEQSRWTLVQFCTRYEIGQGLGLGMGLRLAKTLMHKHTLTCDIEGGPVADMPLSQFKCAVRERSAN
jgi:TnsA endonuclease N terminal